MEKEQFTSITVEGFLSKVDALCYKERVAYACRLGQVVKGEEAAKFIAALRNYADGPQLEGLPSCARDIAANFHREQLALHIASCDQANLPIFFKELDDPSLLMKPMAVKQIAKHGSEQEVMAAVLKACPSVRRSLLSACVAARRHSLLDALLPQLREQWGDDEAFAYAHGCSGPVVASILNSKELVVNPSLAWKYLCRYHGALIVAALTADLEQSDKLSRKKHWDFWWQRIGRSKGGPELLERGNLMRPVLTLFQAYPPYDWIGALSFKKMQAAEITDDMWQPVYPALIETYLAKFCDRFPSEMTGDLIKYLFVAAKDKHLTKPPLRTIVKGETLFHHIDSRILLDVQHRVFQRVSELRLSIHSSSHPLLHKIFEMTHLKRVRTVEELLASAQSYADYLGYVRRSPEHPEYSNEKTEWRGHVTKVMKEHLLCLSKQVSFLRASYEKDLKKGKQKKYLFAPVAKYETLGVKIAALFLSLFGSTHATWVEWNLIIDQLLSLLAPEGAVSWSPAIIDVFFQYLKNLFSYTEEQVHKTHWSAFHALLQKLFLRFAALLNGIVDSAHSTDPAKDKVDPALGADAKRLLLVMREIYVQQLNNYVSNTRFQYLEEIIKSHTDVAARQFYLDLLIATDLLESVRDRGARLAALLKTFPNLDIQNVLKTICSSKEVPANQKAAFQALQAISIPSVRHALESATKAATTDDRLTALTELVTSTKLHQQEKEFTKTIVFMQTRLCNAVEEERKKGISLLLTPDFSFVSSSETQKTFMRIIEDAYEAQQASVVSSLIPSYAKKLIVKGLSNPFSMEPLYQFGVELLLRDKVHQKGEKKAKLDFSIPTKDVVIPEGADGEVFAILKKSYARIGREITDPSIMNPLFTLLKRKNVPEMQAYLSRIWAETKELASNDQSSEHLHYWHQTNLSPEKLLFVSSTLALMDANWPKKWWDEALFADYARFLLESVEIHRVFSRWVAHDRSKAKTKRDRMAKKTAQVNLLLSRSPSAVWLPCVWRHLVTVQQQLLEPFINKGTEATGLFHPTQPRLSLDGGSLNKAKGRKVQRGRRPPRRQARPAQTADTPDSETLFCIPACYGLKRLLPRQLIELGNQWQKQALNQDRPISARTKAVMRWTLMPTTRYEDIVTFLQHNQNISVNLIEAALKGTMTCDEPCVPLAFLLQEKFVTGDRARVSIYAVSKCIPHMTSGGLAEAAAALIEVPAFKVTAYKQLIRLLAAVPSPQHLALIKKAWENKKLHDDVRFIILKEMINLLFVKDEKATDVAWEILRSTLEQPEHFQLALLGVRPGAAHKPTPLKDEFFKSSGKVMPFLNYYSNPNIRIPLAHCHTFARDYVLPMAQNSKKDDIKFAALAYLWGWKLIEEGAPLLRDFAVNIYALKEGDLYGKFFPLYQRRYKRVLTDLLEMTGVTRKNVRLVSASPSTFAVPLAVSSCNTLEKAIKDKHRNPYRFASANVEHLLSVLPLKGPAKYYGEQVERDFIAEFSRPVFERKYWFTLTTRALKQTAKTLFDSPATHPHLQALLKGATQDRAANTATYTNMIYDVIVGASPVALKESARISPLITYFMSAQRDDEWLECIFATMSYKLLSSYGIIYAKDHIEEVIQFLTRQRLSVSIDAAQLHQVTQSLLTAFSPFEHRPNQTPAKVQVLSPAGKRLLDALMNQWKCDPEVQHPDLQLLSGADDAGRERFVTRTHALMLHLVQQLGPVFLLAYPDKLHTLVHYLLLANAPQQLEAKCVQSIGSLLGSVNAATAEGKATTLNLIEAILLLNLTQENAGTQSAWRDEGRGRTEADRELYEQLSFSVGFNLCQKHPELLARPLFQSLSINWTIRKAFSSFAAKETNTHLTNLSTSLVKSLALNADTDLSEWRGRLASLIESLLSQSFLAQCQESRPDLYAYFQREPFKLQYHQESQQLALNLIAAYDTNLRDADPDAKGPRVLLTFVPPFIDYLDQLCQSPYPAIASRAWNIDVRAEGKRPNEVQGDWNPRPARRNDGW